MTEILRYEFTSLATLTEDSVGTYDLSLDNGVQQVTDVGSIGSTAYFDGSTQYSMNTVPSVLTGNVSRSISVWVYNTASGVDRSIISTGNGTGVHLLRIRGATQNNVVSLQNASVGTFSVSSIPLNTWTHVCYTYTPSVINVYIDGVLETTQTNRSWNMDSLEMKFIGENFLGNMVDMRVFSGEVDAAAVALLYTEGPGVQTMTTDPFTHIVDIAWSVPNSSLFSLTENGEYIITDTPNTSISRFNLVPSTSYTYQLYVDSSVSPTLEVTSVTPAVDLTSTQNLLGRIGNDLTSLSNSAVVDIIPYVSSSLSHLDAVTSRVSGGTTVSPFATTSTFIEESQSVDVQAGSYILPFVVNGGASQETTIDSTVISYDDVGDEIIVNAETRPLGSTFIIGGLKASVYELN